MLDLAPLVERIGAIEDAVVIELQWGTAGDEDVRLDWVLELHVVIERPSKEHARYSDVDLHVSFPAEALADREAAVAFGRQLAEACELPLHHPDISQQGGWGDSGFIRDQPPASALFAMTWSAAWFDADGTPMRAHGVAEREAPSGREAEVALSRLLAARFPSRPLTLWIGGERSTHGASYPARLPDLLLVRRRAVDLGCKPSAILRMLIDRVPDASTLELMIGFAECFYGELERWLAIAAWRRGELSDAALDAAIPITRNRREWERAQKLQDALGAGRSVAALVKAELGPAVSRLQVLRSFDEAFPLFGDRHRWIEDCERADQHPALDARLRAHVQPAL